MYTLTDGYVILWQLVDLQVFSIARLTFKPLVPNFPCFSKVIFSVMEKVRDSYSLDQSSWMKCPFTWLQWRFSYALFVNWSVTATYRLWLEAAWRRCDGNSWVIWVSAGAYKFLSLWVVFMGMIFFITKIIRNWTCLCRILLRRKWRTFIFGPKL